MNNTIFDDVFRTMIEKMPYLAVPLINEVFHTDYKNGWLYKRQHFWEKSVNVVAVLYYEIREKGHDFNNNPELFQVLLNEYEEIRISLEKELTETGRSELYTDLTKLIVKIADYIFQKEEDVRKGIGEIMGGKVLELESERLKAEGKAIGQAQGENRLGSLITRLIQDQRTEEIPIVSVDSKRREQLYKEYNL